MEWIVGLIVLAVLAFLLLRWALNNAPTCTCNQPDCGGGRYKRPRRNEGA